MSIPTIDGRLAPRGFVQVAALAAAAGLGPIPQGAHVALIQAEGQNVRWRDDGTAPTAGVGMLLSVGETLLYNGNLAAFQAIEVALGATLNVTFYAGDIVVGPA